MKKTILIFLLVLIGRIAFPSGVDLWVTEGLDGFAGGELDGVSVSSDGYLKLATEVNDMLLPDLPSISSIQYNREAGVFYVATPQSGIIYQYSPEKESMREFCNTGELQVNDLLLYKGTLYAATSPHGIVFAVDRSGKSEVWYESGEHFVWKLAVSKSGKIFAGCGQNGNIHIINGKQDGSIFFEGTDGHITALAVAKSGDVYAGSSDRGLVLKIDNNGKAFVLFDSEMDEISSILVDKDDTLFVSAISSSRIKIKNEEDEEEGLEIAGNDGNGKKKSSYRNEYRSVVFRIDNDGFVDELGDLGGTIVYDMIFSDNNIVVATGPDGELFSLSREGDITLMDSVKSSQITCLVDGGDVIYGGCGNVGSIIEITGDYLVEGYYTSEVLDGVNLSLWGVLRWNGNMPEKTTVDFYSRSGNTEEPDKTWSDWVKLERKKESAVKCRNARFFQWQCRLVSQEGTLSPLVNKVEVSSRERNIPPHFEWIEVEESGVFYKIQSPGKDSSESVMKDSRSLLKEKTQSYKHVFTGKKLFRRGMRTIHWKVTDDNNDGLLYSIFWKKRDSNQWYVLDREFGENYFFWDTMSVPDGDYVVKVTASDLPSNPEVVAAISEMTSYVFTVDNSAPVIVEEKGTNSDKLVVNVSDGAGWIRELRCSFNGGKWQVVLPEDGLADSGSERFIFETEGVSSVAIYVVDNSGNSASKLFNVN